MAGQCFEKICAAVVDTGTSVIAGPNPVINKLIAAIGKVEKDCSNVDSLPTLSFTIKGKAMPLPPQIYVIKSVPVVSARVTPSAETRLMAAPWALKDCRRLSRPFLFSGTHFFVNTTVFMIELAFLRRLGSPRQKIKLR